MIRVSILGATGYSGGELIRLLLNHTGVKIQHLTSESSPGRALDEIHPLFRNRLPLKFEKLNVSHLTADSDVVFSCLPSGVGLKVNPRFLKAGLKVIDLSADFRFAQAKVYKAWYKLPHTAPEFLKSRAYGLPELFRAQIKKSSLVANPGCYATAAILSAAPLVRSNVVDTKSLIVDAKSGASGAGKKLVLSNIYGEIGENLHAYGIASHRHQPEIESVLKTQGSGSVCVTFVPHLIPMKRGILSVLYGALKKKMTLKELRALFIGTYGDEPFIRVLPEGASPQTKNVENTNYCDIGIFLDNRCKRVIVIAAIDNLGKGAAGQAVQNMNLLFNRPETEGLI